MIRKFAKIFSIFLTFYVLMHLVLYFYQEHMLFQFAPVDPSHTYTFTSPHEFITLESESDDASLHGVHFYADASKQQSEKAILYFKGNGGTIGHSEKMAAVYLAMGYDVISMDYRAYCKSRGPLSELALLDDAMLWYQHVTSLYGVENVRIVAWSMGSAFASYVAANTAVKDVILFAPFKSTIDVGYRRYPFLLNHYFNRYPFRNDQRLTSVRGKSIIIYHGTADRIVPYESGLALFKAADQNSVEFISVEGENHIAIPWNEKVLRDIQARW